MKMILNYIAVKELNKKYGLDIDQFYKETDMNNQRMYWVEEYRHKTITKGYLEIHEKNYIPQNTIEKEYHLTVPTSLVLEYLIEIGIDIKIEVSKSGVYKDKFSYFVKIVSNDFELPRDCKYEFLPSVNFAIEMLLISLIEKEIIEIRKGLIIKR